MTEKRSLNDVKSLDDFDIENTVLIRGETPEDIKQKCFHLCKDYLGGVWLKVGIDEVEVNRISGGLTNQLYYCAVNKQIKSINEEPQEVAIRLYGKKHFKNSDCDENERLIDVIIALLISENKLGPKIYGLFEGGQIQQYYKHKQFRVNEQNEPKLVKEVAKRLARIHAMDVPIKKTRNWGLDLTNEMVENISNNFPSNALLKECNCETLIKHDIKQEMQWIINLVLKTDSPIVFCHNDFRGSNIMVTECDNQIEKIVICDFEYSSYGFRGFDFGAIFGEWGKSLNDYKIVHMFHEDSKIIPFIQQYISQSIQIFGKEYSDNQKNSLENILREAKIFLLFSMLLGVTFQCRIGDSNDLIFDRKVLLQFAEIGLKNYLILKQKFMNEKVFQN